VNEKMLELTCRAQAAAAVMRDRLRDALWPTQERWEADQAGLSKLAITVILVAVGVGLTLAVVAILGPAIMNLANQTGGQIESVPMDWGP
jgi:Flp pilus assembly protein TadB